MTNLSYPGMGKISAPCASSHARVSWPGVTPLLAAMVLIFSTNARFLAKFSCEKRGRLFRKSSSAKSAGDLICPVNMPRPRGLYATTATPSSRAVRRMSTWGFSMSTENGLYSTWMAVMGWTAWARRSVAAETSQRPRWRILPCL